MVRDCGATEENIRHGERRRGRTRQVTRRGHILGRERRRYYRIRYDRRDGDIIRRRFDHTKMSSLRQHNRKQTARSPNYLRCGESVGDDVVGLNAIRSEREAEDVVRDDIGNAHTDRITRYARGQTNVHNAEIHYGTRIGNGKPLEGDNAISETRSDDPRNMPTRGTTR